VVTFIEDVDSRTAEFVWVDGSIILLDSFLDCSCYDVLGLVYYGFDLLLSGMRFVMI